MGRQGVLSSWAVVTVKTWQRVTLAAHVVVVAALAVLLAVAVNQDDGTGLGVGRHDATAGPWLSLVAGDRGTPLLFFGFFKGPLSLSVWVGILALFGPPVLNVLLHWRLLGRRWQRRTEAAAGGS